MAVIEELYFAVPIYFSNMAPVFARKLNFFNKPLNRNLFGEHKTYRGFIVAIIVGLFVVYFQKYLYGFDFFKQISLINYTEINLIYLGFFSGFGAMLGDLIKSYFKRKQNIKPGESWVPFDQLDFMIGALIFLSVFLEFQNILILLVLTPFIHIIANHIGYFLGLNNVKW